jgi:hypothetical protein
VVLIVHPDYRNLLAEAIILTTLRQQTRLFLTGSLAAPASRFLCEHLLDELMVIEACIFRIPAQVPGRHDRQSLSSPA